MLKAVATKKHADPSRGRPRQGTTRSIPCTEHHRNTNGGDAFDRITEILFNRQPTLEYFEIAGVVSPENRNVDEMTTAGVAGEPAYRFGRGFVRMTEPISRCFANRTNQMDDGVTSPHSRTQRVSVPGITTMNRCGNFGANAFC